MDLRARLLLLKDTASGEITQTEVLGQAIRAVLTQLQHALPMAEEALAAHLTHFDQCFAAAAGRLPSAWTLFTAQGAVAQKIRTAIHTNAILFSDLPQDRHAEHAALLAQFHHHPSVGEEDLLPLREFFKQVHRRLNSGSVHPQRGREEPGLAAENLGRVQTLYHVLPVGPTAETVRGLTLATRLDCGASVVAFVSSTADAQAPGRLYLHHPYEDVWVDVPGNLTLPGLLDALQRELEVAETSLAAEPPAPDWTDEWQVQCRRAERLFEVGRDWLPNHRYGYELTYQQQKLVVHVGPYQISLVKTAGAYPSFLQVITEGNLTRPQTFATYAVMRVEFDRLPEGVQEQLVRSVQHVLTELYKHQPQRTTTYRTTPMSVKYNLPALKR